MTRTCFFLRHPHSKNSKIEMIRITQNSTKNAMRRICGHINCIRSHISYCNNRSRNNNDSLSLVNLLHRWISPEDESIVRFPSYWITDHGSQRHTVIEEGHESGYALGERLQVAHVDHLDDNSSFFVSKRNYNTALKCSSHVRVALVFLLLDDQLGLLLVTRATFGNKSNFKYDHPWCFKRLEQLVWGSKAKQGKSFCGNFRQFFMKAK